MAVGVKHQWILNYIFGVFPASWTGNLVSVSLSNISRARFLVPGWFYHCTSSKDFQCPSDWRPFIYQKWQTSLLCTPYIELSRTEAWSGKYGMVQFLEEQAMKVLVATHLTESTIISEIRAECLFLGSSSSRRGREGVNWTQRTISTPVTVNKIHSPGLQLTCEKSASRGKARCVVWEEQRDHCIYNQTKYLICNIKHNLTTMYDFWRQSHLTMRICKLPNPCHPHERPNCTLKASPNRLIASAIWSELAAANVARKNIFSSGVVLSALNQLPRETRTPLSTAAWKTSSSIWSRVLPDARPGCFFQSMSIQC